jgi:CRP-like cAMP-binding protein
LSITGGESEITDAAIAAISVCAGLLPEERGRVAAVSRPAHLNVGRVAVSEGEFAFDFYAIKRGAVEVRRGDERIATLGPGDVFGEMGVVSDEVRKWTRRRGASVIVTEPTDVIVIDGSDLRRLTEEIPALRDAIHATAVERSRIE